MDRVLPLDGAANVRDLGGYRTTSSRLVASHKAVRGAGLATLTAADEAALEQYGVVAVVDLRSPAEREAQPDRPIPDAEHIDLPVFDTDETKVSANPADLYRQVQEGLSATEQMRTVYRHFVEDASARKAYRRFFEILLGNPAPGHAVLFHCTAGKDRTGFGAAMLLAALEVPADTIMANYLETNEQLAGKRQALLAQAGQMDTPGALVTAIDQLMRADRDYLGASFTAMDQHFGGVGGFLTEGLGLTDDELGELRARYTQPT